MNKSKLFSLVLSALWIFLSASHAQKTDPYHKKTGGYGYQLTSVDGIGLWWCEGAYKIMRDKEIPDQKDDTIRLWAGINEYEPFQLVIRPENRVENIRIKVSNLINDKQTIESENISIRKVEYVKVSKPTDNYGYKDLWPDPLPEAEFPLTAYGGENTPLWLNVYIPEGSMPGNYFAELIISGDNFRTSIPLKLTVWDLSLPENTSIRSGFGLSVDKIIAYHNLKEPEDIRETFDLYMKAFRDYRISPYSFDALSPVKEIISGLEWSGGYFDSKTTFNGNYSYRIEDKSKTESLSAKYRERIIVEPEKNYELSWTVRSTDQEQNYCVLLECFNEEGNKLVFENKMDVFTSDSTWNNKKFKIGYFGDEVREVSLSFFPSLRTAEGENTGTIWIDNIIMKQSGNRENILRQHNFEVDVDNIDIKLDFSDFDIAAKRYLDDYGFNSFRLYLKGMGGGTYYSREEGVFEGFSQGTPEYKKLMSKYLSQIQSHLKDKGWLGKEYVYWFDEPGKNDYPFVRQGMEIIKESAPEINTFITENDPGPQIMDVTDITCTIWHRIDPEKAAEVVNNGQEYWSYLCTAPKAPWISEFIDHDAVNMRMWLWMTYEYKLSGILIWATNYWTSRAASPTGYLQNPWQEPASFVQNYGWPYGKQTVWGNGDGRFWYPPNRNPNTDKSVFVKGPVPCLRLEFLRQGIEDYEYLIQLEKLASQTTDRKLKKEAEKLLKLRGKLFSDGKTYTKNPLELLEYRKQIARMIIKLNNTD